MIKEDFPLVLINGQPIQNEYMQINNMPFSSSPNELELSETRNLGSVLSNQFIGTREIVLQGSLFANQATKLENFNRNQYLVDYINQLFTRLDGTLTICKPSSFFKVLDLSTGTTSQSGALDNISTENEINTIDGTTITADVKSSINNHFFALDVAFANIQNLDNIANDPAKKPFLAFWVYLDKPELIDVSRPNQTYIKIGSDFTLGNNYLKWDFYEGERFQKWGARQFNGEPFKLGWNLIVLPFYEYVWYSGGSSLLPELVGSIDYSTLGRRVEIRFATQSDATDYNYKFKFAGMYCMLDTDCRNYKVASSNSVSFEEIDLLLDQTRQEYSINLTNYTSYSESMFSYRLADILTVGEVPCIASFGLEGSASVTPDIYIYSPNADEYSGYEIYNQAGQRVTFQHESLKNEVTVSQNEIKIRDQNIDYAGIIPELQPGYNELFFNPVFKSVFINDFDSTTNTTNGDILIRPRTVTDSSVYLELRQRWVLSQDVWVQSLNFEIAKNSTDALDSKAEITILDNNDDVVVKSIVDVSNDLYETKEVPINKKLTSGFIYTIIINIVPNKLDKGTLLTKYYKIKKAVRSSGTNEVTFDAVRTDFDGVTDTTYTNECALLTLKGSTSLSDPVIEVDIFAKTRYA